jgi:putative endonuclease
VAAAEPPTYQIKAVIVDSSTGPPVVHRFGPSGCHGWVADVTVTAMTQAKDAVGAYGERVAARYLANEGMELLDRNWRSPTGEIDIVLRDGRSIVFCEVKTRRSYRFGSPIEAIVPAKVQRLRRLAAEWLATSTERADEVRFDVVSVIPQRSGRARVEHVRGAF